VVTLFVLTGLWKVIEALVYLEHRIIVGRKRLKARHVFILGHPRSGTTFVHYNLLRAFSKDATAAPTATVRMPSLTLQPIFNFLRPPEKLEQWHLENLRFSHSIQEYEEEDMLLSTALRTQFSLCPHFSQSFRDAYSPEIAMHRDDLDLTTLRRVMEIEMVRRGRRLWIGKPITHTVDWQKWQLEFPDALFVWVARKPEDVLRSTEYMYGNWWPSEPQRIRGCFRSEEIFELVLAKLNTEPLCVDNREGAPDKDVYRVIAGIKEAFPELETPADFECARAPGHQSALAKDK